MPWSMNRAGTVILVAATRVMAAVPVATDGAVGEMIRTTVDTPLVKQAGLRTMAREPVGRRPHKQEGMQWLRVVCSRSVRCKSRC